MCHLIESVEWSGVLFYSVKGNIKDWDNMEFIVEDILAMDKGTSTFTGYDMGDEIIEYKMNNPKSLSWKMGMIHSHHNMKSYFSGTDMEELEDNTEFHNYYLSLIVNNKREMVAKVAFKGAIKSYECTDEQGNPWNLKLKVERKTMFTFDCKIIKPSNVFNVPKEFADRTHQVIKECDEKRAIASKAFQNKQQFPAIGNHMAPTFNQKLPDSQFKNYQRNHSLPQHIDEDDDELDMWNGSFFPNDKDDIEELEREMKIKDFSRFILRLGNDLDEKDCFEIALEDADAIEPGKDYEKYLESIIIMYPALFEKYWDIFGEINTTVFFEVTVEVMEFFIEFSEQNPLCDQIAKRLENLLNKM